MREAWTDDRLDDLVRHVDQGFEVVNHRFDRVEADLRELRVEMNTRLGSMDTRIDKRFEEVDGRLDAMQRTMLTMMASMMVGFVAVLASVFATQL